ncbi:MAG TPA: hypothetical protein VMZ30_13895 [Pyrinomonadaceae bacterium]|nr:hypothetical protein [Pyrinomonadaceae bacterium]
MKTSRKIFVIVAITVWLVVIGAGLAVLLNYENRPGSSLAAPAEWPADSKIQRDQDRQTMVMLAHPHCPCTRASIGELARLMTEVNGRLTVYVLFVKPEIFSTEWEKTDLWESASLIPGVRVMKDDAGIEARRFHALTSGDTVLYDQNGKLLFSGGITSARGHEGDNPGRSAIASFIETGEANQRHTEVFGCALFSGNEECPMEGEGH